ncbi:MAG: hypothetical protein NTZ10_06750 [Candidatus Saganbacteria bacterium]|nr:hypothetical protein [Candidatus Saganbacteria bacterium]
MRTIIQLLVSISMYTFILTSLFGAGLGLTIKEIIEPIKNLRIVFLALLSNFALIPLMAFALSVFLKADPGLHAGLIIIACCAGAPFLPKLITLAKGDIAHAVGFMVLMMISTVAFAPFILPLAIPGLSVSPFAIAAPLIVLMLFPLISGLLVTAGSIRIANFLKPAMMRISSVSLLLAGVFIILVDHKIIISAYGTGVYNLTFLFTVFALVIGFFFIGFDRPKRVVFSLGSGARNIAAALIIATANFNEPRVTTVVLIGSLVQFIMLFLFAYICGRVGASRTV